MVFKIVTVLRGFRTVTAITIIKIQSILSGIGYMIIFINLERIFNPLILSLIVQIVKDIEILRNLTF